MFLSLNSVLLQGRVHWPDFARLAVKIGFPGTDIMLRPARAPEMASGDRGFFSAHNEREAQALGVKKVALPARGRLSAKRAEQQKQRWFRRGLRWRAGIEATISTLKHPFSMWRATYKGGHGFERSTWAGV